MYIPINAEPAKSKSVLVCMMIIGSMFVGLSGCSEESSESQANNAMSGAVAEGQGDNAKTLPSDFPGNVPIYEPSDIKTVSTNTTAAGAQYVVGFMAEGSRQDVVEFYSEELEANGWSIMFDDGKGRFTASNGNMNIVVNVTDAGRSTIFTVTTPKK